MLKRKITQQLVDWMNRKDRKSLILEGARQVGKTYSVREFTNTYYKDRCIEINFILQPEYQAIFSDDISMDALSMKLSVLFRDVFKTDARILLFLDEIQACPLAITALKSS